MITVTVAGVRMEMPSNTPIVLLQEESGDRYLPIWVGAVEATAIAYAQQGVTPPRPLTHDLLVDIIHGLDADISEVRITALSDGIFYATVDLVVKDGSAIEVSARPSDAIAVALRTSAPIRVDELVFEEAGVDIPETDTNAEPEDQVEKFREFLEGVSPEDFDDPSKQ